MGLKGKLLRQIEISFHGDVFHEIYRDRPHHVPSMCPIVVGVEGQWETVGSIIIWKFTHDGETKTASEVIESIDDEKKMMKFRVIGGDDVLEYYKSFIITYQVDTNSDGNFVSWSIEYEKLKEEIPESLTYLELLLNITKDIDNHHAKLLNP